MHSNLPQCARVGVDAQKNIPTHMYSNNFHSAHELASTLKKYSYTHVYQLSHCAYELASTLKKIVLSNPYNLKKTTYWSIY